MIDGYKLGKLRSCNADGSRMKWFICMLNEIHMILRINIESTSIRHCRCRLDIYPSGRALWVGSNDAASTVQKIRASGINRIQ